MGNFNRFGGNNRSGGNSSDRHNTFGSRDGGNRLMMHQAVCDDCGKNCEVPFKPTGNREIFCSDCFEKRGGKDSLPQRNDERSYNRFDRDDRGSRNDRFNSGFDRNERPNSNFDRNERSDRGDRFGSGDREMFSAICDDCGKDCQLPFKPSSSKPVYCSRCFEARGEKSGLRDKGRDSRDLRDSRDGGSRSDDGGKSKEIGELKAQIISMGAKIEKIMRVLNIDVKEKIETVDIEDAGAVGNVEAVEAVKVIKVSGAKSKVAKKAAKKAAKEAVKEEVKEITKKPAAKKVSVKKVSVKKGK
jgi:CxxC-x17-CxxC domain-containing protein